ncbi:alpha/beta fold hydrolase [Cohnella caldifontis]|uniref:alpha/beta fold hydrolase n=1 Tax=Cohnella caldifontis TaxID=3027471 RepID=UPI003BB72D3E
MKMSEDSLLWFHYRRAGGNWEGGKNSRIEDLTAVQEATGAAYLFGHSYGGLVALETARTNGRFTKLALYEPGVSVNQSIPIWRAAKARRPYLRSGFSSRPCPIRRR